MDMLLEEIKTNRTEFVREYIHIASLMREDCEVLLDTADELILYVKSGDIYVAECTDSAAPALADKLLDMKVQLIETTSEKLFDLMHSAYDNSYKCFQYALGAVGTPDPALMLLRADDLDTVIATYHDEKKYLSQLFDRGLILGYYLEGRMIGYALRHIDGTLGALYIDPEHRKMGLGKRLTLAAIAHFNDPLLYSQVIDDNTASIRLHESINASRCSRKICWMYNHGFSY